MKAVAQFQHFLCWVCTTETGMLQFHDLNACQRLTVIYNDVTLNDFLVKTLAAWFHVLSNIHALLLLLHLTEIYVNSNHVTKVNGKAIIL